MDTFLIEKIYKKLKFWNMIHLPIAGRVIIVNFVLASTLLFLVNILGVGGEHNKFLLWNFLWVGGDQCAITKVNWFDCCTSKYIGLVLASLT